MKKLFTIILCLMLVGCHKSPKEENIYKNYKLLEQTNDYQVLQMPFYKDKMKIYGEFYAPKNKKNYPVVIIAHGFGSSYTRTAPMAKKIVKQGIGAYVFDFCGGSTESKSEGDMLNMSVMTEKKDMEVVLSHIKKLSFINQKNIYLMGGSQGGLVASLVGVDHQEEVRGIILFYPAFTLPDVARYRFSSIKAIPETSVSLGRKIGRVYYKDIYNLNSFKVCPQFKKPVLIVHGNKDKIVNIRGSQRMQRLYNDCELKVLENAGHGFHKEDLTQACRYTSEFILKTVKK